MNGGFPDWGAGQNASTSWNSLWWKGKLIAGDPARPTFIDLKAAREAENGTCQVPKDWRLPESGNRDGAIAM
jgi:hypothetical protein